MLSAVLTGDIVNYNQLTKGEEKKLTGLIKSLAAYHKIEFYRGDSFQIYIKDAADSLRMALLFRCAAKKIAADGGAGFDVRTSLGIGKVEGPVRSLAAARGEAFVLSGRAFDKLGPYENKIVITSTNAVVNIGLELLGNYIDTLFNRITARQAATIFELLSGYTQKEAARRLKKSQATVNQHLQAANWPAIKNILDKFEQFTKILSQ